VYIINPCAPIHYSNDVCLPQKTSICKLEGVNEVGTVSFSASTSENALVDSITLSFFDSKYNENDSPFIATFKLICDKSKPADYSPSYPSVSGTVYLFKWLTPSACSLQERQLPDGQSSGGLGFGYIFLLIILFGFTFYFLGGILYRRNVLQLRGREVVPHADFWLSLPQRIKVSFISF
jgi:hypothetical protein